MRGSSLSRLDGSFEADGGGALDDRDVLALLVGGVSKAVRRSEIVARYLSGEPGWRDAATELGGAFARNGTFDKTGLSEGKEQ